VDQQEAWQEYTSSYGMEERTTILSAGGVGNL
jgi:hypothetical protein